MIQACQDFIAARLAEIVSADGLWPYRVSQPDLADPGNIFFEELPSDYLKDNDWAAQALAPQDRSTPEGKLVTRTRDLRAATWISRRRRFKREILFRVFLYAPRYRDLWGETAYTGMVEQFQTAVAGYRVIPDGDNNAIRIEPQEASRPWETETEQTRKLRQSHLAIVRVRFIGGIYSSTTRPLVTGGLTINPAWGNK